MSGRSRRRPATRAARGLALAALVAAAGCQAQAPGAAGPAGPTASDREIGERLLAAKQPDLALRAFNRDIAANGVSDAALLGLGVAYLRLGQRREALRFLRAAVDLAPDNAMARNNLGVLLHSEGDYAGAHAEFTRAYALTGGADPRIRDNLGMAEYALEAHGDAVLLDEAEFDVIQYGHGVYRLEPRKEQPGATAPDNNNRADETAPEAQS